MAGVTIKPVVFQEGAPLDPNELNKLADNIQQVYQLGISLQNATTNGSQTVRRVAIVDAGRILVDGGLKAKTPAKFDVDLTPNLFSEFFTSKDTYPFITATIQPSGDTFLDKAQDIQIVVSNTKTPKIILRSETAITADFYVSWTAVAFKQLA